MTCAPKLQERKRLASVGAPEANAARSAGSSPTRRAGVRDALIELHPEQEIHAEFGELRDGVRRLLMGCSASSGESTLTRASEPDVQSLAGASHVAPFRASNTVPARSGRIPVRSR